MPHRDKTADKSGRMDKPKAKAKASPQHHRTLMSSVAEAPPEVSVPDLVDAASFDDGLELDLAADQAAAEARELELEKQPSATETAAAEEVAAESTARAVRACGEEAPASAGAAMPEKPKACRSPMRGWLAGLSPAGG